VQQPPDQVGRGRPLRVAGVHDQQEPAGGRVLDDRLGDRAAGFGTQPEAGGDGRRYLGRVGHRGQVHEPDPIRVRVHPGPGDLHGEPGLAGAAGTHDRHQPVVVHHPGQLAALGLPAHERAQRRRQVVRRGVHRARAREVLRQPGRDELEQPLPHVEAAQPVQPEIEQPLRVVEVAGRVPGRGAGAQHLPTVRGSGDAGREVHLGARVLTGQRLGVPGVQAHAHQRLRSRPLVPGQLALGLRAGVQRRGRVLEGHEQRVALREQRRTVATGQCVTQQLPVLGEHPPITRTEHLGQPG
jgi:hypothetical protein